LTFFGRFDASIFAKNSCPSVNILHMANLKMSWAKRRWKIFLNAYQSNPEFRSVLDKLEIILDSKGHPTYSDLEIFPKFKVPIDCVSAIALYMCDKELSEEDYLLEITPPFFFWSTAKQHIGPEGYYGSLENNDPVKFLLNATNVKRVIADTKGNQTPRDIIEAIAGPSTILQLFPYLKKQEIHDLIDYYWDEIEPLLMLQPEPDDIDVSSKLLGKVHPLKTRRTTERNAVIMVLNARGRTDKEIWNYLLTNEKKYKPVPALQSIKSIRRRIKKSLE